MKFSVPLNILRAARTHSAENDIRHYLCGVYLDTSAGKVVATDGHRLLCADVPGVFSPMTEPVIIKNETLDAALAQFKGDYARGKNLGGVHVSVIVADNVVTIETPTGQVTGTPINATFPNWRRVVPKPEDVGAYTFAACNFQYIADACDAVLIARNKTKKMASDHTVGVYYRGENPAVIADGVPGLVIIVMPIRASYQPAGEFAAVALREAHAINKPADSAAA